MKTQDFLGGNNLSHLSEHEAPTMEDRNERKSGESEKKASTYVSLSINVMLSVERKPLQS